MEIEIDHYKVLGLESGEEALKLSDKEITSAYRKKALQSHPDKRLNDSEADAEFQRVKSSYEILKDCKARQAFNDLIRARIAKRKRESNFDSKRRKMVMDLDARERAAAEGFDPAEREREVEEERIAKRLKEEIARIRAMHSKKNNVVVPEKANFSYDGGNVSESGVSLDRDRILKVSWTGSAEEYCVQKLREIFGAFGDVEDVIMRPKKKRTGFALVVMATKDAAVAAMGSVCGDVSNPLVVTPMRAALNEVPSMPIPGNKPTQAVPQEAKKFVGMTFEEKEKMILEKLRKAGEKQKSVS